MKTVMMVLMMLLPAAVFAQKKDVKESDVPAAVKNNFMAKYPNTKNREWKVKNTDYEVDFMMNNKKYEAKYEADGTWKKTSLEISKRDVPAVVINSWKSSEFGKWMLDDAEQVETIEYKMLYLVKVVKGMQEMELLYTPAGELLKAKDKNEKK